MSEKELYLLVENFFGYKCKMRGLNSETKEVMCILYDSFLLRCNLENRYGRFEAGIIIDNGHVAITEFLGRKCSLNSDEQSIKESLQIIDDYCRERLPEKFLNKYYKVYAVDNCVTDDM